MDELLRFFNFSDVCSLSSLAAGLGLGGLYFAGNYPTLRARCFYFAGIAFVLYMGYTLVQIRTPDAAIAVVVLVRGALLLVILNGSLCIVFSLVRPVTVWWNRLVSARRARRAQRRYDREESERREREAREWERRAPERARQAADEEIRQRRQREEREQHAALALTEQRRRDDVRMECYLLYDRHVDQLETHFPRQMLQEYFETYMKATHSAAVVEQRARLLMEMLREQINSKTDRMAAFTSLADVAAYFREQRQEVETLPYDEETRESLLFAVNKREDAAIAAFLNRKN